MAKHLFIFFLRISKTCTTNSLLTKKDKHIEQLDTQMSGVSVKLEDEKKLNGELMKILSNLENTQNGSEILIDNSKYSYNTQYYNNWEIFVGILIVSGLLTKFVIHSKNNI